MWTQWLITLETVRQQNHLRITPKLGKYSLAINVSQFFNPIQLRESRSIFQSFYDVFFPTPIQIFDISTSIRHQTSIRHLTNFNIFSTSKLRRRHRIDVDIARCLGELQLVSHTNRILSASRFFSLLVFWQTTEDAAGFSLSHLVITISN